MTKQIRKYLKFFSLCTALLLVLGFWQYRTNIYSPIDPNDDSPISFQVKKGQSIKEIGKNLKEKDLIRSTGSFYIFTKNSQQDKNIQAGRFLLNKTQNIPQLLETLSDAQLSQSVITIQEGLLIKDIDQKLVELELIQPGAFLQAVRDFNGWQYYSFLDQATLSKLTLPLEGYLYPDTYFLDAQDFQAHDLIYLALDNFERKFGSIKAQEKEQKNYTTHQIITMASIIENEVFGKKDKHLVSGILWKRLESSWPIGADATLLYITEDRQITKKDLQIDSPYNTRKNLGLPPGPISNPSLESIKAAYAPTSSPYWFYLTTLDTGKVIYATTNEEHNVNRYKYLK